MIVLLSPAKKLDFENKIDISTSTPEFINKAAVVNKHIKQLDITEIEQLQKISNTLATLNFERNQKWSKSPNGEGKPSIFSFKGEVYVGLDADSLLSEDLDFAQEHLRILSGLYGWLKPLDKIMPYRLEMGTKLKVQEARNLYEFWKDDLTDRLLSETNEKKSDLIINLASKEYAKAVNWKKVDIKVIEPIFKDWKNDQYKIISFFAKKARGMMARFIIDQRLKNEAELKAFNYGGYAWNEALSQKENAWVFTRKNI